MTKNWRETIEPIAQRLEVAAKFNQNFVHDPEGAKALAALLRSMADKLDIAVQRENDL